jgi:hypothetical protein
MTDPRVPADKQEEAQLPDDLDQNPGIGQSRGLFGQHGSEDAQLLAGESTVEGDVENDAATVEAEAPDDLGRTND